MLTGSADVSASGRGSINDYHMRGTYTIPRFTGCGLGTTDMINAVLPGSGNTVDAHVTR